MHGQGLRRRLGWSLVTGSLLIATLGVSAAGTAVAAQRSVAGPQRGATGGTIKVCKCTSDIAADLNTHTLWLASPKTKAVSVISERTRKVLATINIGSGLGPSGVGNLVVDPVSRTVWVFAGAHLIAISDKTMKVARILKPRGYLGGFDGVVDPTRGEIWVIAGQYIQGISEVTGKVARTVFLASGFNGDNIASLAADPKTGTIFASVNRFSSTRIWLYGVDEASGTRTLFDRLPGSSLFLAVDPVAGTVWGRTSNGFIEFGATGQHKTLGRIRVNSSRFGPFAEDPTTRSIWMGAINAHELTRFSEGQRARIKTLPLPGRSLGITLDTRSHTVFVLLNGSVRFFRY